MWLRRATLGIALLAAACSGGGDSVGREPAATPTSTPTPGPAIDADAPTTLVGRAAFERVAPPVRSAAAAAMDWASLQRDGLADAAIRPRATLEIGVNLTHEADILLEGPGTSPVADAVHATVMLENQHLMGFGTLNPNPAPGVYEWASLDARVEVMRASGATPVITLCCAPDWMKGGTPGQTDWDRLEVAPAPEHYDDFAALAAAVATRYPDIGHYVVWNELKGFHDPQRNDWNIEGYTELYNAVHTALKGVSPEIAVGGPYVTAASWSDVDAASHPSDVRGPWGVLDSRALGALEYWLANSAGADFVVVDGGPATRNAGLGDPGVALGKLRVVGEWLRARTDLPIWWTEFHAVGGEAEGLSPEAQAALFVAALVESARGGVDVAMLWPSAGTSSGCHGCLWFPDGSPSPLAEALPAVQFALAHTEVAGAVDVAPGVVVVPGDRLALAVNATGGPVEVPIGAGRLELPAWSHRIVPLD